MVDESTEGLVLPVGLTEKQMLQQMARLETRLAKFERDAVSRFKKGNAEIAGSFSGMSRQTAASLQNVSFQLQDIFVQIQGGQGAVRALSQQMPQLLSGFGAFGAAAGLAAAALIPLAAGMLETGEKASEFDEAMKELAESTAEYQRIAAGFKMGVDTEEVLIVQEINRLMADLARVNKEWQSTDSLGARQRLAEEASAIKAALAPLQQQLTAYRAARDEAERLRERNELAAQQAERIKAAINGINGSIARVTVAFQAQFSGFTGAAAEWAGRIGETMSAIADGGSPMFSSPRPKSAPALIDESAIQSGGSGGGGGGGGSNGKLDALIEDLKTEREILEEWYAESLALLNSASEAELEALGGKHAAIERLEVEHQDRMAEIKEEANRFSLEMALGAGADVLGAMGAFNRKALKVSQAFAAAEALVSTYKGAAKALEKGALGFPEAAAVIAKGLAFVGAIKGINEGGGGAARGGGATAAAAPVLPVQRIDISASGSPDFMAGMQSLIDTLSAAAVRGLRVDPRLVGK